MTLREISDQLGLEVYTGSGSLAVEVTHGYVSDMLSDVIGDAPEGSLWITMQKHKNIVAVAVMKSLAGIVLIKGRTPEPDTAAKAEEEGVVILGSNLGAFELAVRLSRLGVAGG